MFRRLLHPSGLVGALCCFGFLICVEKQLSLAQEVSWESLTIYPAEIKLNTAADFQNVIAVASRSDGITLDVTDKVEWSLEQTYL